MPEAVETTDASTAMENCSSITEKSTVTSMEAMEWKRKFEEAEQKLRKRTSKRMKRLENKTTSLKMKDIKAENHLPIDKQYFVRTHVKKTIWRNLKYWQQNFEKRTVKKALKVAGIADQAAKIKYADFTGAYMRQLLIVKRNNSVAALKKKVKDEIESTCCNISNRWERKGRSICTILTDTFFATEFLLPKRFKSWGGAIEAVIEARGNNVSPYDVDIDIWNIFEIMAFELVPRMNG